MRVDGLASVFYASPPNKIPGFKIQVVVYKSQMFGRGLKTEFYGFVFARGSLFNNLTSQFCPGWAHFSQRGLIV